ncbi:hypothetical protein [Actinomadura alba]|uniref:Uncharacterized protein n=1 Tax=Actinomadura alba TaxID=406431 RepID=A0ABR7LT36_9ACTN|nr:hypothetical protein [Actinomadura alba]MBC6468020.1 hypothetical protein [Actinomadura alba]
MPGVQVAAFHDAAAHHITGIVLQAQAAFAAWAWENRLMDPSNGQRAQ